MNRIIVVGVAVLLTVSVCGVSEAGFIAGTTGTLTYGTGATPPSLIINGALTAPLGTADITNAVTVKYPGNDSQSGITAFTGGGTLTATVNWTVTNSLTDSDGGPEIIHGYMFSITNNDTVGATITSATAPDAGWTASYDTVNGLWANFAANSVADWTAFGAAETLTMGIDIPDFVDLGLPFDIGEAFGLRMQAATPEPGSFALLGMGLVGLYGCRRRSRKAKAKAPDKNETA